MLLLIAAIFSAAGGIHYQTPMLGPMAAEFGADTAQIGWIPTATFGGFLAGIALLAPLGDRMDKRALILRQHFACIVALLAAAAAPTLATAAAAGFVIGICGSTSQSIIPLGAELAPPNQRGSAVGTVLTALFLGILFARIVGGVVAAHLGWRWMYVIGAAMMTAVAPVLLMRLPPSPPKTSLSYRRLLRSLFTLIGENAELRRVLAIQLLTGLCYGGFWATIATMLLQVHGLGPQIAGLI